MATIADLIIEATEQGYDVTITMRLREDRSAGFVRMPNHWARRLGMSEAEIERLREAAIKR